MVWLHQLIHEQQQLSPLSLMQSELKSCYYLDFRSFIFFVKHENSTKCANKSSEITRTGTKCRVGCEHANSGSFFLFDTVHMSGWKHLSLCLCRGRGFTLLTICHACVLCFPLCSISLTTCVNTLYRVLRSPSAEELFIQLWPVLTSGPVSQTQLRPHQLPLFSITTSTPSSTCSCPLTASVFKLKNPPNIYLKPSHVEVETMNAAAAANEPVVEDDQSWISLNCVRR